jgi:glycosyltransferase involved in cell wall biosynthesis
LRLDVFFRTCSNISAVNGTYRVVNASKTEIVLRCLNALIHSMGQVGGDKSTPLSLTVVDDHSDPECLRWISKLLAERCDFPRRLIHLEGTGNGASLLKNYELARKDCDDLIYFVEDDYLHDPAAIGSLLKARQQLSFTLNQDIVLFPCDNPKYYEGFNPAAILTAEDRYWRAILSTTATVLVSKKTLVDHWERFIGLTRYEPEAVTEADTINRIYETVPCFSPMPSLAAHLVDGGFMPRLVNWISWWEGSKVEGYSPPVSPFHSTRS